MRFLPARLRESCRRGRWALRSSGERERRMPLDPRHGHPPGAAGVDAARGQGQPQHNSVYLTGVLADDPQRDKGRTGEPVTLLIIAFLAPDPLPSEGGAVASCEIEVPDAVTAEAGGELRVGAPVLITGSLSGGGGVLASSVRAGEAPGEPREAPLN